MSKSVCESVRVSASVVMDMGIRWGKVQVLGVCR